MNAPSRNQLEFRQSIFIQRPSQDVYDYTQDYGMRILWDRSVKRATVIQTNPVRMVKIWSPGGFQATFKYKLERPPFKTSLLITQTNSKLIIGGGGSWIYEPSKRGTLWTQRNTLILSGGIMGFLMRPIMGFLLSYLTKKSMIRAMKFLEAGLSPQ